MTTGPLDGLRLLARDSSCDGIMGFGAFHPRQAPTLVAVTFRVTNRQILRSTLVNGQKWQLNNEESKESQHK